MPAGRARWAKKAAEQRLARCLRESEMPADKWIPQWVPDAFSGRRGPGDAGELAAIMSDFHPVGFRAMSRALMPDFREALPLIEVPTLLIWGDDDKRSPLSNGELMRDSIPGSRLVVIPGAGHASNMEQPERFNAEVRDFCCGSNRHSVKERRDERKGILLQRARAPDLRRGPHGGGRAHLLGRRRRLSHGLHPPRQEAVRPQRRLRHRGRRHRPRADAPPRPADDDGHQPRQLPRPPVGDDEHASASTPRSG